MKNLNTFCPLTNPAKVDSAAFVPSLSDTQLELLNWFTGPYILYPDDKEVAYIRFHRLAHEVWGEVKKRYKQK